jgi:hypothetical protein
MPALNAHPGARIHSTPSATAAAVAASHATGQRLTRKLPR